MFHRFGVETIFIASYTEAIDIVTMSLSASFFACLTIMLFRVSISMNLTLFLSFYRNFSWAIIATVDSSKMISAHEATLVRWILSEVFVLFSPALVG